MVSLFCFYRLNKNAPRTDILNDNQKAYAFVPTYGDGYTAIHRHMIAVVVFFSSNTLKSILVDYAVTDMGCFDKYSDAAPRAKTLR